MTSSTTSTNQVTSTTPEIATTSTTPETATTPTIQVISTRPELFTLAGALTPDECAALIRQAEALGFTEAPITIGPNRFRMAPEIRNNTRVILDDEALARRLWGRVAAQIPARLEGMEAVGLNERFRFYRYEEGEQFNWHRDGAFHRSDREWSLLTLIFYLNEGCDGGATEFLHVAEETIRVVPRTGHVLAFSHPILHRGAPVLEGIKFVLRTDVMYRLPPEASRMGSV
jgi:predicted 2-oxoglutarate/Fe(II)-dependent dioxygenase YbiX